MLFSGSLSKQRKQTPAVQSTKCRWVNNGGAEVSVQVFRSCALRASLSILNHKLTIALNAKFKPLWFLFAHEKHTALSSSDLAALPGVVEAQASRHYSKKANGGQLL